MSQIGSRKIPACIASAIFVYWSFVLSDALPIWLKAEYAPLRVAIAGPNSGVSPTLISFRDPVQLLRHMTEILIKARSLPTL